MTLGIQVLLVEDNPRDLEMTMRAMKKHNLANRILTARDGSEALEVLFATGAFADRDPNDLPHVIFLDLKLPKIDGIEVLRRIKEDDRTRRIPVVIVTSLRRRARSHRQLRPRREQLRRQADHLRILRPHHCRRRVLLAGRQSATPGGVMEPDIRILLVEDDDIVAEGLAQLLELEGMQVRTVNRGMLVEQAIESFAPGAVVLDVGLPDVNGIDVYEGLAKRWPTLPVIFSSGHADPAPLRHHLKHPRVRFLHKPYDVEALIHALSEIT